MALFGELSYALILPGGRSIASIVPDVVFEEGHRDELIITQHPVESGTAITDHAFKRPQELDMRCGWSDSAAGYAGHTREVYAALRRLQDSRRPFSVSTGKRLYRNMLLRSLVVITDPNSENALMVIASFQQIIIVSTQQTSTGSDTTKPGEQQSSPESTGAVTDKGEQSGQSVTDQSFAGSFNPGNTSPDGGTIGNGNFDGVGGLSPGQGATPTPDGNGTGFGGGDTYDLPPIDVPSTYVFGS